jgi:hypothetical protein
MVIVVSGGLDVGQAANVVGLLGISLGHHLDGIVGPEVEDAHGRVHAGMSSVGLPVLLAGQETLDRLHDEACQTPGVRVFDVTDAATSARDYSAYTARLQTVGTTWRTFGLAIVGSRRNVDALTGRLGLLR